MKQTVSMGLSIMKSISVWKWNSIGSVSTPLLLCKSWSDHQRICFLKWLISCYDTLIRLGKSINVSILNMAHSGHLQKGIRSKNKHIESNKIYIQDDSAPVKRLEKQCQVFRNANVVKEGPLGGGTWPALNHNDIYAARPLKLSKYFLPCLCLRQIFWCEIFLLSNRIFLIFVLVSEHRWLVRGWMAAILAVMFKWLFI